MDPKEVQKILNETDWDHYRKSVSWRIQMPDCHFYDGEWAERDKHICPVWQGWLNQGRSLYSEGEKGLAEYLKELQQIIPEGFRKIDHRRAREFLKNTQITTSAQWLQCYNF